ncbi:MAG: TetR/AcrR family transcriptional regulator [Chloroflexota bacterium]
MADKQRKLPKQARSWQRYHHMLDTAAQLFDEHGIDPVTTNHIAETAGVPIGSLYQFFPNKDAIIEGLIERYHEAMRDVFPTDIDTSQAIEDVIHEVLSGFMAFKQSQLGFQTIIVGIEGTSHAHLNTEMQAEVINGIKTVLKAYYPQLSDEQHQLCAMISFSITVGMMPLNGIEHDALLKQMVMAVSAYQRAFVASMS